MYQDNRHIDLDRETEFYPEDADMRKENPDGINNKHASEYKNASESNSENRKRKVRVKEIIDGTFLVRDNMIRQLPYVLFLTVLGVIYIGNRFNAERMVRQIDQLKIEVGNLRSEQITTTSELMNISRPSEVAALVESKGLGLKESMEPPKKLKR